MSLRRAVRILRGPLPVTRVSTLPISSPARYDRAGPSRPFSATHASRSLTNIFEASERPPLSITKLTPKGFHLSDGLLVPGGLMIVEGRAILWDVDPPEPQLGIIRGWQRWSKDAFSVFETLMPRPEMVLFGTGQTVMPVPKEMREYVSGLGIQLDVMDSRNAASTYNLLSEEGRRVAAALCPLKPTDPRTGKRRV